MVENPYSRQLPKQPLQQRNASPEVLDFIVRLLSFDPNARPPARDCLQHPWIALRSRPTSLLPLVATAASPKNVRATPRIPSPDHDSSDSSSRSSSPSAMSSSSESEDERNAKTVVPASPISERMDICSIRSERPQTIKSIKQSPKKIDYDSFMRAMSPMNVDTMKPAEKVWCMLYPLPGNAAGSTTLFLTKTSTIVISDTKADFIFRHPLIAAHHCTILSGSWNAETGLTGVLQIDGQK